MEDVLGTMMLLERLLYRVRLAQAAFGRGDIVELELLLGDLEGVILSWDHPVHGIPPTT